MHHISPQTGASNAIARNDSKTEAKYRIAPDTDGTFWDHSEADGDAEDRNKPTETESYLAIT